MKCLALSRAQCSSSCPSPGDITPPAADPWHMLSEKEKRGVDRRLTDRLTDCDDCQRPRVVESRPSCEVLIWRSVMQVSLVPHCPGGSTRHPRRVLALTLRCDLTRQPLTAASGPALHCTLAPCRQSAEHSRVWTKLDSGVVSLPGPTTTHSMDSST